MKPGDYCIYPAHGVTVVKRIDERELAGKRKSFYVLQVVDNQMTIMCPVDATNQVGIRPLVSKSQAFGVLDALAERGSVKIDQTTWNRRYREYMEKIKTGDVLEVAQVLRNLTLLRRDRDISFGERKMMDQARHLLAAEIALVLGETEEAAGQRITAALEVT